MRFIIYCDESVSKGKYYSDFYGGALLLASKRQEIEEKLLAAKGIIQGEVKWTKISEYNESAYIAFVDAVFELIASGDIKMRIMFTQNINDTSHFPADKEDNKYFMLYYQFLKHAFGLRFCNIEKQGCAHVSVYLDDAPDTKEKLDNFKNYLSSLSSYPIFHRAKVSIAKDDITEVNSKEHIILQAVDVILGSMQFRLNNLHKEIPEGKKRRGKRTKAKDRVYRHINKKICEIYPRFNIGTSTARLNGAEDAWSHNYRHWCFKPRESVENLSRGKKQKK
jgi:hypothetical protein